MTGSHGRQAAGGWLAYVQAYVRAYAQGESVSGTTGRLAAGPDRATDLAWLGSGKPPVVVLCSPHPDDEILTGALPLRLRREQGARVVNIAVTLGSDPGRQGARWQELQAACGVVDFECRRLPAPPGFDLKAGVPGVGWQTVVEALAGIFADLAPDVVFLPHADDLLPAHVATHHLATAALALYTRAGAATVTAVETEYWRPMAAPNLLVGLASDDLALLLTALACHQGEVARNPYHLTHPGRMMDTVRRGAELVKAAGTQPGFLFGELYRVSTWRQGESQALNIDLGWISPNPIDQPREKTP